MKKSFLVLSAFAIAAFLIFQKAADAQYRPPMNGIATVTNVGATDRLQLPDLAASACSFQAPSSNTGAIYVGGYTVTNASGTNVGILIAAGGAFSNVSLTNLKHVYIAADTSTDKLKWLCN